MLFEDAKQMNGPVMVLVYMTEHDGRGGCKTQFMGRADHVQPLLRIEFVRTDNSPDIVADPRTDKSIFRIHRDIRFSKEKIPYKTHLGIYFWEGEAKKLENPGFYFQFDKDTGFIGVGMHIFPKEMMAAYRTAVIDPKKGEKLVKIIKDISKKSSEYILGWKKYKQTPRGYDKNHSNADYLLYGGMGFHYKSGIPDEFYSNKIGRASCRERV